MSGELDNIKDKVQDAVSDLTDGEPKEGGAVDRIGDEIKETLGDAKDAVGDLVDKVKDKFDGD